MKFVSGCSLFYISAPIFHFYEIPPTLHVYNLLTHLSVQESPYDQVKIIHGMGQNFQ